MVCLVNLLVLFVGVNYYKIYKLKKANVDTRNIYKDSPSLFNQVVLFGDSRVKEWGPTPVIGEFVALNRGVSGETTVQMVLRFEQDALAIQPDFLIIQAGINDIVIASMMGSQLEKSIRLEQCVNNLRNMVDLAVAKGIKVIIFSIAEPYKLGIIRSVLWGRDLTELVREVNRQVYSTHSNYIIDTNNILSQTSNVKKDALHFTYEAYEVLNNEIYSHLLR